MCEVLRPSLIASCPPSKCRAPAPLIMLVLAHHLGIHPTFLLLIVLVLAHLHRPSIALIFAPPPAIRPAFSCLSPQTPTEDMRCYSFPPLISKQEQQPSSAQAKAAMALVTAMDLTAAKSPEGVPELLKPEETPNPTLARFYAALGKVSLHPGEDYTGKEEEVRRGGAWRHAGRETSRGWHHTATA